MKKIWNFFDQLNEIVYVSDMDTYDLIYLNRAGLDAYGLQDPSQAEGRKCYELLQGSASPCAMCTNPRLRENAFVEWRYFNPIMQRHVKLKDTMVIDNGRLCRMEIAVLEDPDRDTREQMLNQYQNMEKFVKEAFREALNAPSPELSLDVLLEYVGKALQADRIYIFEKNEKGNDDNTYEWCASGVSSEIDGLQDVPGEVCAGWYETFREKGFVIIKDLEAIRESEPALYGKLKPQNIHSLVTGPLTDGNRIVGFYGVDNPPPHLLAYSADILQIMGQFTSAMLKIRNQFRQLQHLSYHDQLTGLGNRHAMRAYVQTLQPGQPLGVLFCDVTGLKETNDTLGHAAGDDLLVRAANCLRAVFPQAGLFRIGGDELVVVCTQSSQKEELEVGLELLKTETHRCNVNLAIGMVWEPNGTDDFDNTLKEAEHHMYTDKEAYYRATGRDRRGRRITQD